MLLLLSVLPLIGASRCLLSLVTTVLLPIQLCRSYPIRASVPQSEDHLVYDIKYYGVYCCMYC